VSHVLNGARTFGSLAAQEEMIVLRDPRHHRTKVLDSISSPVLPSEGFGRRSAAANRATLVRHRESQAALAAGHHTDQRFLLTVNCNEQ
jgi:hypothetical protein